LRCNICDKKIDKIGDILDFNSQYVAIELKCHGENILLYMTPFDYSFRDEIIINFRRN